MNLTLTWQWVVMMVQRFVNWLVYTFWIYSKKSLALTVLDYIEMMVLVI